MNTQKLHGARHSEGGIKIEAEGGERIFSREDTAKIESLSKQNKFEKLGKFIKGAMQTQDSRPPMYAEQGMKVFNQYNNELPFVLSPKEMETLNQFAAMNNTMSYEQFMEAGGKIASITQQMIKANPNNAALKNNNPGNIMYYSKDKQGNLSKTPSGYAKYLLDQGYEIEAGSSNQDGQFIKFKNLEDGMAAKLGFWNFVTSKNTYGGQPVDGMTLDEALSLYSNAGYTAKDLGLGEFADTYISEITQDVWNKVSANQIKREDGVMYKHLFGTSQPNDIDFSNFSTTPVQTETPVNPFEIEEGFNIVNAKGEKIGEVEKSPTVKQEKEIETTLEADTVGSEELKEKEKRNLASKEIGNRQKQIEELEKEKQKYSDQIKGTTTASPEHRKASRLKQNVEDQIKQLQDEIDYLGSPIHSTASGKIYGSITDEDRKLANESLKQEFEDFYYADESKVNRRTGFGDDTENTKLLYDKIRKRIADSDSFKNKNLSKEDADFLLDALTSEAFMSLEGSGEEIIKNVLGIEDTKLQDTQLEDLLQDDRGKNVSLASTNKAYNEFRNQYINPRTGKQAKYQQDINKTLNLVSPSQDNLTATGAAVDPNKVPSGQQVQLAAQKISPVKKQDEEDKAAQAMQIAAKKAEDDANKDFLQSLKDYDPSFTGEATTTYEDLFQDDRTTGQKFRQSLLDNAVNIAQVVGGIKGAAEPMPRFMISQELIDQAKNLNQRAQTGLTAEEKSKMLSDATDAERSAMNAMTKSGLSSGQILGIAPQLQRQTQKQKLNIDILDQKTRERYEDKAINMQKYLNDLRYRTQFMPDYQETQQRTQAAAQTAQAGIQGFQDYMGYQRTFGEGTPYQALQEATIKNIISNVRAGEMATSANMQQADFIDQQNQAIASFQAMSPDQQKAFRDNQSGKTQEEILQALINP